MARDRQPIVKQSRREGYALHPKAIRAMAKKVANPYQGGRRPSKPSQYSIQLREKQKVRRLYGLLERQFRKVMAEAVRQPGQSGENLLRLLEMRLDNAVYRAGFAPSRRAARQLVGHGHFMLNGRRVDIPSILVKPGDSIELRQRSISNEYFKNLDDVMGSVELPSASWLKSDKKKFTVTITGEPKREEAEPDIQESLIVEFYSR